MYSLYVISNKPERFPAIVRSLAPERVVYYDGSGHKSFSQIVNRCVASAGTELVIIMSDKVLPTPEHVRSTVELLQRGYAFVALYRFAFFGFRKELMRRIGMMDENFVGGGYEDDDFFIRLVANNLAMYVTHDVPYTPFVSSWDPTQCRQHFLSKWRYDDATNTLNRALPEPAGKYDLGPSMPVEWLTLRENSYVVSNHAGQYFDVNINNKL